MIAIDRTEVTLSGEELATIFWRGRQWAVTDFGIGRLDGTFSVPAPRLTESRGRSMLDWPLRIMNEPGADIDDFATAFLVALIYHGAHGIDKDVLQLTFSELERERIRQHSDGR